MDFVLRKGCVDAIVRPFSTPTCELVASAIDRMIRPSPNPELTFGYLSTVHSAAHGYFGGYLIISALGRPLEFHCSAPVRPNRAQEILYGPTLQPYLLGEQIGGTLLSRAKLKPRIILTNQSASLCLRARIDAPLALLLPSGPQQAGPSRRFTVLEHEFELPANFEADVDLASQWLKSLGQHVDFAEPFDRIHEAIREAQRIGDRGEDAHGRAA